MIEFKGELTGNARKYILNKQMKIQITTGIIAALAVSIPVTIACFLGPQIFLFGYLLPATMIIGFLIPPNKKFMETIMPQRIYLDLNEKSIVRECGKNEKFRMFHSVEQVVDYGEWYHFVFAFGDKDIYFVCQKSLLTQGTLEEFEALFEGKISRHNTQE